MYNELFSTLLVHEIWPGIRGIPEHLEDHYIGPAHALELDDECFRHLFDVVAPLFSRDDIMGKFKVVPILFSLQIIHRISLPI
jgi:hypothetical protein